MKITGYLILVPLMRGMVSGYHMATILYQHTG